MSLIFGAVYLMECLSRAFRMEKYLVRSIITLLTCLSSEFLYDVAGEVAFFLVNCVN